MYDRHLETFICVADCRSFSKAAEKLYVSPNAVMKQVNHLEARLGFPLFQRSHRGLLLTEEGQVIYAEGKKMIEQSDQILRAIRVKRQKGVVRIGHSFLFPAGQIMHLWARARRSCPDIQLKAVPFSETGRLYQTEKDQLWKEIDVLCANLTYHLESGGLRQLPLGKRPLCLGMSMDHPLAKKGRLCLETLQGERIMVVNQGLSSYIDEAREELRRHPGITIIDVPVYDMDTFNRCENEGLLMLSVQEWEGIHPGFTNIPVDWALYVPYGLMYRKNAGASVRRFVEAIREAVGSQGGQDRGRDG